MSNARHVFRRSSLFQFKHGAHTCLLYSSDDVLLEILTPYVAEGLFYGERCFCAQKPEILRRLMHNLTVLGVNTEKEIKRGALDLHTEAEVYGYNEGFNPHAMMDMLIDSIQQTREQGFTAFRSAGELSWLVEGRDECEKALGYEKMVQEYYPGQAAVGLCQYPTRAFSRDVLKSVSQYHSMTMAETAPNSVHFSMHVPCGSCTAEVVADNFVPKPRFYYVVQQKDDQEMVGWGIEPGFDRALKKANQLAVKTS